MTKTNNFPPHAQIFKLTFTFFGTGMLMFIIAIVAGIWIFPWLIETESVRNPKGWALAHLLLLGFATMIAMGASYQLTQVLLRTSIYSKRLGMLHYAFYTLGFVLLTISFIVSFVQGLFIGGMLVLIGVGIYIGNLLKTFIDKKEWGIFHFGVSLSLLALLFTILLGIMMGMSFAGVRMPFSYEALFAAHVWFGVGGWLSGLIIVYTFKLIPMFYSSPRKAHVEAYLILALFHLGVWGSIVSIAFQWQGAQNVFQLFILASLAIYVFYLSQVPKHSRSHFPVPGGAVSVAYGLNFFVFAIVLCWTIIQLFFPQLLFSGSILILETIVVFVIIGWFAGSILSYMSKIVPFLWWGYQFQTTWKKKSKILLSKMTRDRRLNVYLFTYLLGVLIVCAAFLLLLPSLAIAGQIVSVVAAILYLSELVRVFKY